jgi:hypothetical protein
MSFNFPGSATVNVSGNVSSVPATVGTMNIVSGTGIATLGTVGAGKKWKIINIFLSCMGAAHQAEIKLNDVANQFFIQSNLAAGDGLAVNIPFDYTACPVLTVGQTIKSNCSGGVGTVCYIEEAA